MFLKKIIEKCTILLEHKSYLRGDFDNLKYLKLINKGGKNEN